MGIFDYTYVPLKSLGYALHPLSSNDLTFDKETFLYEISKLLLQGFFIILLTKYYTLYYAETYLKEPGKHLLLIIGYDSERDIVKIQDAEVIGRGDTAPLINMIYKTYFFELYIDNNKYIMYIIY